MNEDLNLVEILKDCPKGTLLYSTIYGEVNFDGIVDNCDYSITFKAIVKSEYGEGGEITTDSVTKNGLHKMRANGECTLFPSKENRDWSNWKCPKPKFDLKTLQPFDKILVRNAEKAKWSIDFFGYIDRDRCAFCAGMSYWENFIPYNDDTKHLVGTTEDAPEYYRYWED